MISGVYVEHAVATDGTIVPINDVECRKYYEEGNLVKEVYYSRGYVFARFHQYHSDGHVTSFATEQYFTPTYPAPTIPGKKNGYPTREFMPYKTLRLMATNVTYENWVNNNWVVGSVQPT